jgi:hypothetical protein
VAALVAILALWRAASVVAPAVNGEDEQLRGDATGRLSAGPAATLELVSKVVGDGDLQAVAHHGLPEGWVVVVYDREEAAAANGFALRGDSVRTRVHLVCASCCC